MILVAKGEGRTKGERMVRMNDGELGNADEVLQFFFFFFLSFKINDYFFHLLWDP